MAVVVDTGYAVANGPAIHPGGEWMLHTDSARRTIYAFDLHTASGALTGRRVWKTLTEAECRIRPGETHSLLVQCQALQVLQLVTVVLGRDHHLHDGSPAPGLRRSRPPGARAAGCRRPTAPTLR